jgi:hypothetical protein
MKQMHANNQRLWGTRIQEAEAASDSSNLLTNATTASAAASAVMQVKGKQICNAHTSLAKSAAQQAYLSSDH